MTMPRPSRLLALLAVALVVPAVLASQSSSRSVRIRQRRGTCKPRAVPEEPDAGQEGHPPVPVPVVVDGDKPVLDVQRRAWCSTAVPVLDISTVQRIKNNLEERGNQSWVSGIRWVSTIQSWLDPLLW